MIDRPHQPSRWARAPIAAPQAAASGETASAATSGRVRAADERAVLNRRAARAYELHTRVGIVLVLVGLTLT